MSNSQRGLMTQEQWNSYLLEWCWHILQPKKRESGDLAVIRTNSRWLLTKEGNKATERSCKR